MTRLAVGQTDGHESSDVGQSGDLELGEVVAKVPTSDLLGGKKNGERGSIGGALACQNHLMCSSGLMAKPGSGPKAHSF